MCIACPQRMDGRSWLCLDTAQLLVQDVAPIICCNCSERLLAASWDVRDCSGQVVFCPPWGSSGLCEGMVLARILENVVWIVCTGSCPAPIPLAMCCWWYDPIQCQSSAPFHGGCQQHQAELWFLQWVSVKRARVLVTQRIPESQIQT